MSTNAVRILIILPAFSLSALSLAVLSSIAPGRVLSQTLFLVTATMIGWGVYALGARNLLYFSTFFYVSLIVFLALTIIFGRVTRGSVRWLEIAGIRGQVSELAKPTLLLVGTALGERAWKREWKKQFTRLVGYGLIIAAPMLLVLLQPDLGTGLVILIISLTLLFASGIPRWLIVSAALLCVSAIPASTYLLADYQLKRIEAFIDPYADPRGAGYQVIQSTIAVGSGQLFGRGLGHGTQSRLQFLPERQTDFIFASLVEELGLVGGMLVIGLYLAMLFGLIHGALIAKEKNDMLVCVGCAGWLFFQATTNMMMNLGLAPVTGITLPFLSAGGSSLVSSSVMLGLAASTLR